MPFESIEDSCSEKAWCATTPIAQHTITIIYTRRHTLANCLSIFHFFYVVKKRMLERKEKKWKKYELNAPN